MIALITEADLKNKTDIEIAAMWNELAKIFKSNESLVENQKSMVGILQLSRETERRKLVMSETKFGKIVLEPKPTKCSKCGDEGWIYQGNGKVRQCNCKPIKRTA